MKKEELNNKLKELKEKQLELMKEYFDTTSNYLDEMLNDLEEDINDKQADFASLHLEIKQLLSEGKYDEIGKLTDTTSKASNKLILKNKKYSKVKKVADKVNTYKNNLDDYDLSELVLAQIKINDMISELEHKVLVKKVNPKIKKKKAVLKNVNENKELKEKIEKINNLLEEALDTLELDALDEARDLINTLEDGKIKTELLEKLASTEEQMETERVFKEAERLVCEAELTGTSKDFYTAINYIKNSNLPDNERTKQLDARIKALMDNNYDDFMALIDKIEFDIKNEETIKQDEVLELADKYKNIPVKFIDEATQKKYDSIIKIYNNQKQDEFKENLDEKDIKKHSLLDRFRESMGMIGGFIAGSKFVKKINDKRLARLEKKLDDAEQQGDNEKIKKAQEKLEKKTKKVKNSVSDNTVVSGLRLFMARNKLARLKLKLYKGEELTEVEEARYNSAIKTIGVKLTNGLNKKLKDETIATDKERVVSILDQYLELIATGTYDKETFKIVENYLESVKDVFSLAEYLGYFEEIRMIKEYRELNDGAIYEIETKEIDGKISFEVDNVIKYYDSDDYKNSEYKSRYIK